MKTTTNIAMRIALAGTLLAGLLAVSPVSTASAQVPSSNLAASKDASARILAGESVNYSLGASNNGVVPLFNVSFRDVLPLGVTYAGPTSPSSIGEPDIVTNQVVDSVTGQLIDQQTLIWRNVADLQPADSLGLSFDVELNDTPDPLRPDLPVYVVGSTVTNDEATAYASANPRRIPRFDRDGEILPDPAIEFDDAGSATTTIVALDISKSSTGAAEGELLRGVHDQVVTYTVRVDVTDEDAVEGIVVTDLVPAALEYLADGTVDNSQVVTEEYPGSGPLGTGPAVPDFVAPDVVETVQDPVLDGVTYPGVYTLLRWNLGTLPAGGSFEFPYAAGIPLQANAPFPDPAPATDGSQGANLDNNTGADTRELTGEQTLTNVAFASGEYQGPLAPGTSPTVIDLDQLDRSIEDVAIRKSVSPGDFVTGGVVDYSIVIDTSEYVVASDIVLTDTLPNGICPLDGAGTNYAPNNDALCNGQAGLEPSIPYASVTPQAGGGFVVVFDPITSVDANGSTTVTYSGRAREFYEGGDNDGLPTASGDAFTNTVSSTASTTPIPGVPGGTVDDVGDASSATQTTGALALDKQLLPRDTAPRLDALVPAADRCPDPDQAVSGTTNEYIEPDDVDPADRIDQLGFRLGDQVCFRLRVDFDDFVRTRNAVITDFLPLGTAYVPGSVRATADNTVPLNFVEPAPDAETLDFPVGTDVDGQRYTSLGSVFEVVFAVEIIETPATDEFLLTGNLMKLRVENTDGNARSFRDEADFLIVSPPPVEVVKGIASINGDPDPENEANSDVDGLEVRQADEVRFRIDLTNLGTATNGNEYSVRELDVLDVLPDGIVCADISDITNYGAPGASTSVGECLDDGESSSSATNPYTNSTTFSVIRWFFEIFPGDDADDYGLFPGDELLATPPVTESVFYTMTIPTPTSVSTTFDNDAGLRAYGGFTNLQNVTSPSYVPRNNIDPTLEPFANAAEADDDSFVVTPGPSVGKFVTSQIVETSNNESLPAPTAQQPIRGTSAQAVVGEYVTYRYFVDIPAETSVFSAELTDQLPAPAGTIVIDEANRPAGVAAPSLTFYADATDDTAGTVPAGVVFDPTDGSVDFGAEYRNDTATDQRFEVVISARVTETGLNQTAQPNRDNTVRFESNDATGTPLDDITDTARTQIRQPIPTLDKTVSGTLPGQLVRGGDSVTFTLEASTAGGRPPLHDVWVEDCVPAQFENVALVAAGPNDLLLTGAPAEVAGCATGETYLAVSFGTIQPGNGNAQTRSYTADVRDTVVGGEQFTNTAVLAGTSLDDGDVVPGLVGTTEREYSDDDQVTLTVAGAGILKTVDPDEARIGERVEFTVNVVVPADTNFFQAAIVDTLPEGLVDPQLVSTSCFESDENGVPTVVPCTLTPSVLSPVADPGGDGIVYGLYYGDVAAYPQARAIRVVYTVLVDDIVGNVDGVDRTNTAQARWDLTDEDDSVVTDATYDWDTGGLTSDATVQVVEPDVVVSKTASDDTPEPGEVFTYTVTARNNGSSEAHDLIVTDVVPDGVDIVLIAGVSPSSPGVYNSLNRTITWEAPDGVVLEAGQFFNLTYQARLAPSADIGSSTPVADFTNTATIDSFASLSDDPGNEGRRSYVGPSTTEIVTPQFPELDVVKTVVDAPPAYIGEAATWEIEVTNVGDGSAFSVDVVDLLPPNWTYDASSTTVVAPGGTTTPEPVVTPGARDQLEWADLGELAPGESLTVTFDATPGTDVTTLPGVGSSTAHVNDTSVTAVDGSAAPGNLDGPYADVDDAQTRIDQVDLSIDKSHIDPPVAGEEFDWTIIVSNAAGGDTAVGPFTVVDTLPPTTDGVELVSAGGTGWSCDPATGPTVETELECTRTNAADTLAAGASFPAITVTFDIPSDLAEGTVITNDVTIDGRTYEDPTDLTDNTDSDDATVVTRADLVVDKTLTDPPGLVAGTDATYTVEISNDGPSTSRATIARPIVVTDTLPAGTTFVSAADSDSGSPTWTCSHDGSPTAGIVTCERVTDIADGETSEITVVVSLPTAASGDLTNTATVTPDITTDPDTDNNTDETVDTIDADADLSIVKDALGPEVAGEPTEFRLTVTNNGPSDAQTVTIVDELPDGLTFASSTDVTGTWTCAAEDVNGSDGFRCDLDDAPLPFTGDTSVDTVVVEVSVDTASSVLGTVTNTATVSSTTPDGNADNDTDTADVEFVGEADLTITKTSSGVAAPGGSVTWTIEIENLGPSDSQAPITVTDSLPTGIIGPVTVDGVVAGDGWDCSGTVGTNVSCEKTSALAAGDASEIEITAIVDPAVGGPDPITNLASVSSTTDDTDPTNNTDTDIVDVIEPDVTLTKDVDDPTPEPGDTFTYTIELENASGATIAPAYGMVVTDTPPAGVEIVSIADGGTETSGTITWNVAGPLAPGGTTSVSFVARLADSATLDTTPIVNTASLDSYSSQSTDGRPYTGNTDDATVTPRFPALVAAKTALGPTPTYIGDEFAWQVTITNTGNATAATVDVADVLPVNFGYVAGSSVVTEPSGVTNPDPAVVELAPAPGLEQQLTWADLGPLTPGQSLTISFRTVPTADVATDPGIGRTQAHTNTVDASATDGSGAAGNADGPYVSNEATADAFIDAADLVVEKSNTDADAVAGEEYTWTIVVRNDGPDTAVGTFVVTDTLPADTTYVGATGTGWTCSETTGTVTCNRTDAAAVLANGAAFDPISVTVAVPSDAAGELLNSATVSARTFDPDTTNNADDATVDIVGEADLEITKNRSNTVIVAGQPSTYTIDVANLGPSTSRADITVVDTLPASVSFVSASVTPDPWNCSHDGAASGGDVTCVLAEDVLAGAAAPQITITVDVASGAQPGVDIVNAATVSATTTDPNEDNDTDSDTGRPDVAADLLIDKQATGELIAGEQATYRFRVVNNGPSDAASPVRITDTLPTGLTYVSSADVTGAWTCTPANGDTEFTCDLTGALVAGDEVVVDVTVLVAPSVDGDIENTASVSSPTPDPDTGNNTDTDDSAFDTEADLAIAKTSGPGPYVAGENVVWSLVVTNNGPSDAQPDITVTDVLPDSVELVTATGDGWVCSDTPTGTPGFSDTVTCVRAAALAATADADPISIVARILPDSGPGSIANTATVSGTTLDPDLTNNSDDDEITVVDEADVRIDKTVAASPVRAGENVTFTIVVTNDGPSTADGVVVSDTLPSGLTVVSAVGADIAAEPGFTCSTPTAVRISCDRAFLAPGESGEITVVATVGSGVPDGTTITNTAVVSSATTDTDPGNNADDADVEVVAEADLAITKSHAPGSVSAGTALDFDLVVVNNGPSDAVADVTVTDTLPAGFTYVAASGPWTCAVDAGDAQLVGCTYTGGALVSGQTAGTLTMTVQLDPTLDASTYDNVASTESPTTDPVPDNDTDVDTVVVETEAAVSIVKTHDPADVRIGEEFAYALAVRNDGPSEARGIVVTDPVPDGFTVVDVTGSSDPSAWDCTTSTGQDVRCVLLAPLAPGADAEPISVTVLVEQDVFDAAEAVPADGNTVEVPNTATVTSETTDPDLDDNTSTDVVVVPPLVDLAITKTHVGPVAVGEPVVFTLTVTNNGPVDDQAAVTVTDEMPEGLTLLGATSEAAECVSADDTATCVKADGLAVGETFSVEVEAEVTPAAYPTVTNVAEVSTPTDDVEPSNDTAADPIVVPALVDLAITKAHVGPVVVGGQIEYAIVVTNNGPTADPGPITVSDTVPDVLVPLSADGDGLVCEISGQQVDCVAEAPLEVDASLTLTVVADVLPDAYPEVENTATVTTGDCVVGVPGAAAVDDCRDVDLSNNVATDTAPVEPVIDLVIDKTLASQNGTSVVWNMVVTNTGLNDTIEPITVTDDLPAGLAYGSVSGNGWVCSQQGGVVECVYDAVLAAGATTAPIVLSTLVVTTDGTQIVNTATVDGGTSVPDDDTDDATVVVPETDLPASGGDPDIAVRLGIGLSVVGVVLLGLGRRRFRSAS